MKKLLLTCFLALGIGANAQLNYNGDFEDSNEVANNYSGFTGFSVTAAAACSGSYGGQLTVSATTASTGGWIETGALVPGTNGMKVNVTAKYKKTANVTGTLMLALFEEVATNTWGYTAITTIPLTAAAITTCQTVTGVIPEGVLTSNKNWGIGFYFTRTGSTVGSVYVDDIVFVQDPTTGPPATCATVTNPVAGSVIPGGTLQMKWNAVSSAAAYKVSVGSTSGGTDVFNGTVYGTSQNVVLGTDKNYFAKVVPTNDKGDAAGCTEFTFSTNNQVVHCGPLISTAPTAMAPIKSVNFAGVTNTSDAAATTIGAGFNPHEFFTNVVFNIDKTTMTSVPLTVQGITNGNAANGWAMTVYIDWNNDGDFDDASEAYFNTPATMVRVGGVTDNPVTLVGNITIPATASPGNKTMRIKYNFQGSTTATHPALATACSDIGNGQVEEYTIKIAEPAVAPSCVAFTAPVNGATDFPANSTITWEASALATGYKVYIGTTSGGTDVANGVSVSTNSYSASLTPFVTYYAKVLPYNAAGEPTGCTEITFTTKDLSYCAAGADQITYEKIDNVNFNGNNNASTSTAGYEDFTSVVFEAAKESTYPIAVTISADYDAGDRVYVWIDYNKNGIFDTNEKVELSQAQVASGNIVVPANAVEGNTRMRVRLSWSTTGGNDTSCGNSTYGQVEDYTVKILPKIPAATADVNKAKVTVYPNPFHDVLKISDVKGVKSISVSDVSGRHIKSMKVSTELDLSELKTGLYIVTLQMEDGTVRTVKAIKK